MLDDIMLFVHLVECGSFKKTAELMGIQQSTISKHISSLENKLGKKLLIRDTRNMCITGDGTFIYDRFKHFNDYIASTIHSLSNKPIPNNLHGSLTISLASALSYELVCPHIDRFNKYYPEIKINLIFQANEINWNKNNLDLALTIHQIKGNNLNNRFMRTETARLYCRPEYVTKYSLPQTVTDLTNHRIIGMIDANNESEDFVKMVNCKNKQEHILDISHMKLKVNNVLHMKKIGMNADYIFGCWDSLCINEVNNGSLIPILPDWETYRLNFYLVSRKNITAPEQKFIDFIYGCMGYFV